MSELWPLGPIVLPHDFWVDGQLITLPEVPIPRLFGWLAYGQWWELFPALADPTQIHAFTRRFAADDDEFDYEHWHDVATLIFGRMTGFAALDGSSDGWWPGRRLAASAVAALPVYLAYCAEHGQGPFDGTLHAVLGRVYAWLRAYTDPAKLDQLDRTLYEIPTSVAANGAAVPKSVADAEAALALAALTEMLPGDDGGGFEQEWTPPDR